MDFLSDPPRREQETAPECLSIDAELIVLAGRIGALELARDSLFEGIEDDKIRDSILDKFSAEGEALRARISFFRPRTLEGCYALARAISYDRWGRGGEEISSEFDETLTEILVNGLNDLSDNGLNSLHQPQPAAPKAMAKPSTAFDFKATSEKLYGIHGLLLGQAALGEVIGEGEMADPLRHLADEVVDLAIELRRHSNNEVLQILSTSDAATAARAAGLVTESDFQATT